MAKLFGSKLIPGQFRPSGTFDQTQNYHAKRFENLPRLYLKYILLNIKKHYEEGNGMNLCCPCPKIWTVRIVKPWTVHIQD